MSDDEKVYYTTGTTHITDHGVSAAGKWLAWDDVENVYSKRSNAWVTAHFLVGAAAIVFAVLAIRGFNPNGLPWPKFMEIMYSGIMNGQFSETGKSIGESLLTILGGVAIVSAFLGVAVYNMVTAVVDPGKDVVVNGLSKEFKVAKRVSSDEAEGILSSIRFARRSGET